MCTSNAYYSDVIEVKPIRICVHVLVNCILWGVVVPSYMEKTKAVYAHKRRCMHTVCRRMYQAMCIPYGRSARQSEKANFIFMRMSG